MSRILAVCGALAVALMMVATMVFGFGDAATVVPSPELVAEGFVRQLAAGRFEQTRQFLSTSARNGYDRDRLHDWFDRLEKRVGGVLEISAQHGELSNDTAKATVHVQGRSRESTLQIPLRRENGVWVVLDLPPI